MKRKSLLFLLLFALLAPWAANAQTSLFSEDFESGSMPTGWTTSGDLTWTIGVGDYSTSTGAGHGDYNAKMSTSYGDEETGMLITPVIDLSSVTSAELSFMYVMRSWSGDTDELHVYYRTSSTGTWTQIEEYTDAASSWTTVEGLVLPNLSSTYQIAFEAVDLYGYGVGVDYINIVQGAATPKPSNLAVSNVTDNSATLSWQENGTATSWQICLNDDETNLIPAPTNPFTLTGLTAQTAYTAKVRSVGTPNSDWTNPLSFMTKQNPVAVGQGWSDDFESTGNWLMVNGGNNAWVVGSAVNNGGSQSLYISNDGGATNAYTTSGINMVYATKLMTFETGQYIFTYNWQANGEGSYDYIRAWLAPSTFAFTANQLPDGSTSTYQYQSTTPQGWISLDGGSKLNGVTEWQSKSATVDVTAGDYYVVFMWGNDGSGGTQPPAAIDNFEITKVACAAPTAFAASNVMGHKATLSWTSDGSAWQLAYTDDATIEPDNLTPIAVTTNSYQLTGLAAETLYYAYVRTDCGGTYSAWTSTTFTTDIACPTPTGLAVTLTPGNGSVAALSWTENGTATEWDLEFSIDATFADFRVVNVANTPSTTLEGLTPEITYYARVKTYCGGEDGYSEYSNIVTFTPTDALSITVNDGTTTNGYVPVYGLYVDEVSKSQFIIPAADLADMANNIITKMTFYASTASSSWGAAQFEVYMTEVDYTTFEAATLVDWTTMTKVRNAGALSIVDNKMVVELTSPYQYMGGNLMIGILETTSGSFSSSYWYGVNQETEHYTAIGGYESSKALSRYTFLPKTTFNYEEMPNCFATNLTIEPAAESAALTWTSENENFDIWYRELVYEPSNDFESSAMRGWTNIDADGDGYVWVLGSEIGGIYLVASGSLAGGGHNESNDLICSGSYSNFTGNALTPDNYLVSPKINLGGSITFWACAQDASYPAEVFGVAVSTTGNTDAADFTTIQQWTMTAKGTGATVNPGTTRSGNRAQGVWYEYTVDLSDYAGETGYVAIRHFGCTDQFILNVDDIVIVEPEPYAQAPAWTEKTSTTNSYTITGLTPETEYEVQVRANCGDGEYSEWLYDTFWTTPLCEAPTSGSVETGTDYITLSWVSDADAFDIMLDNEIIEEGYEGYTYTFEDLDPGTTYLVAVRTNCRENGTSDWIGGQFMTDCLAFDLPYEYNFDDVLTSDTPDYDCWEVGSTMSTEPALYYRDQDAGDIMFTFVAYQNTVNGIQYLITPELETTSNPILVEFEYEAGYDNGSYGFDNEAFMVGYSEDGESFEWFDEIEVTSVAEWETFSEEVPAGTKYVAIMYTSPGALYLNIDNFSFTEAAEGQTIELTAGWNWVSTYIDLNEVNGIEMFEEALGDYGLTIALQDDYAVYVGDGLWLGLEDYEMTNAEMVMIEVTEDCTITLEGPTVDPSTVEITLNPGWTWFGFPVDSELELDNILVDPEPEFGDVIASCNLGGIQYLGEWLGDFDMMLPGQGYNYWNETSDVKTLTFITGDEKARHNMAKPFELNKPVKKLGESMTKSAPRIIQQIKNKLN